LGHLGVRHHIRRGAWLFRRVVGVDHSMLECVWVSLQRSWLPIRRSHVPTGSDLVQPGPERLLEADARCGRAPESGQFQPELPPEPCSSPTAPKWKIVVPFARFVLSISSGRGNHFLTVNCSRRRAASVDPRFDALLYHSRAWATSAVNPTAPHFAKKAGSNVMPRSSAAWALPLLAACLSKRRADTMSPVSRKCLKRIASSWGSRTSVVGVCFDRSCWARSAHLFFGSIQVEQAGCP
jgi:hypothetical protein